MSDNDIKYSDSPWAPDWAKKSTDERTITSFGKPLPQADYDPRLDVRDDMMKSLNQEQETDSNKPFKPTVEQIEEILWQDTNDDEQVYCIMDGYWADGLYGRLLNNPDLSWAHLFQGDVATRNVQQAPFIIALKRGHKLTKWLVEEGWGQGWGIYFTASTNKAHLLYGNPRVFDKRFLPSNEEQLKLGNLLHGQEDPLWKMRRHFRRYSDAYLEERNQIVDFRYHDPWVLSIYLKVSERFEVTSFFGPITHFITDCYSDEQRNDRTDLLYIMNQKGQYLYNFINKDIKLNCPFKKDDPTTAVTMKDTYFHIRNSHISAYTSELEKAFTRRIKTQINNEPLLENVRGNLTPQATKQLYALCEKYDLMQEASIYGVFVYGIVFGCEMTEKTIQKWLNEKLQKQAIGSLLYEYTLTDMHRRKFL